MTLLLVFIVLSLITIAALFSVSETGMMAVNRYRIRHLAKSGHSAAKRVQKLLSTPDKLLGAILIANTFANILASALATVVAIQWFGEIGALIASILLTLIILIFAEVIPKTLAVLYPEKIALSFSGPLKIIIWILYPLVITVNKITSIIFKIFRVNVNNKNELQLSQEELRTVVNEASALIPKQNKMMLLSILDLKQMSVNDIMIPRQEIVGIDLNDDWDDIHRQLLNTQHTRIPLFSDSIDQIKGLVHLRDLLKLEERQTLSRETLLQAAQAPYFIPEGTALPTQLLKFQQNKSRLGFVVDEYGEMLGLITLEDILEEIVGNFTTNIAEIAPLAIAQPDQSFLVEGSANIRELNRKYDWTLPTKGPKTLSGAIIEYLETMPSPRSCLKLGDMVIEIVQVKGKMVKTAKIFPNRESDTI